MGKSIGTPPGAQAVSDLPPELVPRYRRGFVPSHYSPYAVQTPAAQARRSWFTESNPSAFLTDGLVQDHLRGKLWIGPIPRVFSRCAIIDLDVGQDLARRGEKVRRAFPEADPLVFSTPRNGRHLYYMLEAPGWSDRIHQFAVDRLEQSGIELAPGLVEVYPDGGRAIRAPLGLDCQLLDAQTLEPVNFTREQDLWTLDELLRTERYDRLEIPADYGASETPAEAPRRTRRRGTGEFMQQVDKLVRFGLDGPGQRVEALKALAWHCRVIQRMDGPATATYLWTWMKIRHNGQSADYTRNPEQVRRNIDGWVKSWKWEKVGDGAQRPQERPGAAPEGLEARIGAYTDSLPISSRERAFLGKVLEYVHKRGSNSLDDGDIEAEIPARTLKSFDRRYWDLLETLARQNYLVQTRNYTTLGRCRTYRVQKLD